MHNPHDALFGAVFADPRQAMALLHCVLPPVLRQPLADAWLDPVPTDTTNARLQQHRTDRLFVVRHPDHGPQTLSLMEHKAGRARALLRQVIRDVVGIGRDWTNGAGQPPFLLPVVVHHGRRPLQLPGWRARTTGFRGPKEVLAALASFDPRLRLLILDLCKLTESGIRALPLLPLGCLCCIFLQFMPRCPEPDCLARIESHADLLRRAATEPHGQHGIEQLHSYLLHVTTVSAERLAGHFARILHLPDPNSMISTAQRLRSEGRAEGRAEGKVELLLQLLVAKFGRIPDAAAHQISRATDSELDAIGVRLLSAATLDEALRPTR